MMKTALDAHAAINQALFVKFNLAALEDAFARAYQAGFGKQVIRSAMANYHGVFTPIDPEVRLLQKAREAIADIEPADRKLPRQSDIRQAVAIFQRYGWDLHIDFERVFKIHNEKKAADLLSAPDHFASEDDIRLAVRLDPDILLKISGQRPSVAPGAQLQLDAAGDDAQRVVRLCAAIEQLQDKGVPVPHAEALGSVLQLALEKVQQSEAQSLADNAAFYDAMTAHAQAATRAAAATTPSPFAIPSPFDRPKPPGHE